MQKRIKDQFCIRWLPLSRGLTTELDGMVGTYVGTMCCKA